MIENSVRLIFSFSILIFIFSLPFVNAKISINIDIKESFVLNEKIYFNYSIISDSSTEITFIPYVDCPKAPLPPMKEETINLTANELYSNVYTGTVVEDFIESQTCTAYIQIINPVTQRQGKAFEIDTNPSFGFELFICKNQGCLEKSKTFIQNEEIYLDYESDVTGLSISATLTKPDKSTKQISLPTSIKADQVGTYTVKVTASKEGYKTAEETVQFAVIEKEASIPLTGCNNNKKCEPSLDENYKTCPQDCPSGTKDNYCDKISDGICDTDCDKKDDPDCGFKIVDLLDLSILAISIILIIVLYFWYRSKRSRKTIKGRYRL